MLSRASLVPTIFVLLLVAACVSVAMPVNAVELSNISESVPKDVELKDSPIDDERTSDDDEIRGSNIGRSLALVDIGGSINSSPASFSERNLGPVLRALGFTLIWDAMGVIIGSGLASSQSKDFYTNISKSAGSTWRSLTPVQHVVITYGILQLVFAAFTPILWQCVQDLAFILSLLVLSITFGTFRLLMLTAYGLIVITLALVHENNRVIQLVSAP